MNSTKVSVVLPVYNEIKTLDALNTRLIKVLEAAGKEYEIIYVNDGSSDGSLEKLNGFRSSNANIKIVSLSRNFGHQIALMAGLSYSRANCTVIMDADLQDPPELISQMLAKWKDGFEIVYGIRRQRKESWAKRICYKLF